MTITETKIAGCFLFEPKVFEDERGVFFESFNQEEFEKRIGKSVQFVQDNHSKSYKGVLRGLHFQKGKYAQAKLVRVIHGEVLDVVVDIRKGSLTFGEHFKMRLSDQNHKMLFIPQGMAHGFLALSQHATFVYKCDNYYNKSSEGGIIFNDSELRIDWEYPEDQMLLSHKDKQLPGFKELQL